jgi:hypothetical protein
LTVAPVTDVGVSNVTVTSATSASALFAVGPTATLGDHTIVVSTSEGASNTLTFKVLPTGQQDLNGDGHLDFVALFAQEHEEIAAFINDGRGGLQERVLFKAATPSFGSSGIQLVDLDKDGDVDILLVGPGGQKVILVDV